MVTAELPFYIVVEFMANGDLKTFLRRCRPEAPPPRPADLSEQDMHIMGTQVLSSCALLSIHANVYTFALWSTPIWFPSVSSTVAQTLDGLTGNFSPGLSPWHVRWPRPCRTWSYGRWCTVIWRPAMCWWAPTTSTTSRWPTLVGLPPTLLVVGVNVLGKRSCCRSREQEQTHTLTLSPFILVAPLYRNVPECLGARLLQEVLG